MENGEEGASENDQLFYNRTCRDGRLTSDEATKEEWLVKSPEFKVLDIRTTAGEEGVDVYGEETQEKAGLSMTEADGEEDC